MSWQSPTDPCHLPCMWHGTEMCVRCLLSDEGIAEHHLSLAVACGLRHVYHPNNLPPCVHQNGDIDWQHLTEDETQPLTEVH